MVSYIDNAERDTFQDQCCVCSTLFGGDEKNCENLVQMVLLSQHLVGCSSNRPSKARHDAVLIDTHCQQLIEDQLKNSSKSNVCQLFYLATNLHSRLGFVTQHLWQRLRYGVNHCKVSIRSLGNECLRGINKRY